MYQDIRLTDIRPNPANPRKRFEGRKFEELKASIAQVGVIEPVLVRPVEPMCDYIKGCQYFKRFDNRIDAGECTHPDGGCEARPTGPPSYELIAGERRWRASLDVSKNGGSGIPISIPAIVKDVDDDTAFELMTIENLQREDLSELEEARGFAAWVDRKGADRIGELADRCGLSVRYIRRRLAVLELPEVALDSWHAGEIRYGHLEQFLRIKDDATKVQEMLEDAKKGYSVKMVQAEIDRRRQLLESAIFDTSGCGGCRNNTAAQLTLWGIGEDGAPPRCMHQSCFVEKTAAHLNAYPGTFSKYGTTRAVVTTGWSDPVMRSRGEIDEEDDDVSGCLGCKSFVTIFSVEGEVDEGRACIGEEKCYDRKILGICEDENPPGEALLYGSGEDLRPDPEGVGEGPGQEVSGADEGVRGGEGGGGDSPRVPWHGAYFREKFYQENLKGVFIQELLPFMHQARRLVLFSFLKAQSMELQRWWLARHDPEKAKASAWYIQEEDLMSAVMGIHEDVLEHEIYGLAVEAVAEPSFGAESRHRVAHLSGIDLAGEFAMDEEYLGNKTISELLALGAARLGGKDPVFETQEAFDFLTGTLGETSGRFDKLKKGDLVRVFLESGVTLEGRVPEEVLRA